jgi:hypothetical protein
LNVPPVAARRQQRPLVLVQAAHVHRVAFSCSADNRFRFAPERRSRCRRLASRARKAKILEHAETMGDGLRASNGLGKTLRANSGAV